MIIIMMMIMMMMMMMMIIIIIIKCSVCYLYRRFQDFSAWAYFPKLYILHISNGPGDTILLSFFA